MCIRDRYESQLKQDEYDSEVYPNPEKQENWNEWVKNELTSLEKFQLKEIELEN